MSNDNNVIPFKRKDECDNLERLQNMARILHERIVNFDGSEKELANIRIELNVVTSLVGKLEQKTVVKKVA